MSLLHCIDYNWGDYNKSFNEIERAVGILKNVALPDLKADLLEDAQEAFIKKTVN